MSWPPRTSSALRSDQLLANARYTATQRNPARELKAMKVVHLLTWAQLGWSANTGRQCMGSAIVFFLAAAAFPPPSGTAPTPGRVGDLAGEGVGTAPIKATNIATKTLYKAASSEKGGY